jgi:CRP-like cAMP-binding protein
MAVKTNYLANILGQDPEALLALRELPAFHDCSGQLLEALFRYGKVALLREGEELTREGEFDQWVYFIITGRLAVYVGQEHVDTITSSLVGERCILGEHRRATLRAAEGGVTALGVDMALLDALRDQAATVREPIAVYLELLSIITGEVVNRIAELEFNLLDFTYKYLTHTRTERLSDILRDLARGAYRADRNANFAVYRYLLRNNPVALSRCAEPDGYTVDTRQLYADAVLAGEHDLLYRVAEAVQAALEPAPAGNGGAAGAAGAAARPAGSADAAPVTYAAFTAHIARMITAQHGAHSWSSAAAASMAAGIRKRLRLNEAQSVNLRGLLQWLTTEYRFTAEDTIDLLMSLLKESSDATARINGEIKRMVHELTQTRFAKELESASLGKGLSPAEYYHNTPLDELIPFFSKNILDVYLVQPYAARLQAAEAGAWEGQPAQGATDSDGLITTLFE